MKLSVHDVAKMFDTNERTIERWIRDEQMPHARIHGQLRFHHSELLEWANRRGIRVVQDAPASVRRRADLPTLAAALQAGGVNYDVAGSDRGEVLRAVVDALPASEDLDRELLFEVMLARETLASTGVGEGIAIPHVRSPIVLQVDAPTATLCFLRAPIDFGAIDGAPVHTVFALVTPTIRSHLVLLARLSAALHDEEFRRLLRERAPAAEIIAAAGRAEMQFVTPAELADEVDDDENEQEPTR